MGDPVRSPCSHPWLTLPLLAPSSAGLVGGGYQCGGNLRYGRGVAVCACCRRPSRGHAARGSQGAGVSQ
eukprot:7352071-Alexandrium_andersonii.AAC.1